jgi:uncharacterized protein
MPAEIAIAKASKVARYALATAFLLVGCVTLPVTASAQSSAASPKQRSIPNSERQQSSDPKHAPNFDAAFVAYESGQLDRAIDLFLPLAARGDPIARYNLAVISVRGQSARISRGRALRYLRASAQTGFAAAQFMLGALYENGQWVRKSSRRAMRWYQPAAEQGHVDAQLALGTQFYLGRGAGQDFAQAAHWYQRAAQGGDVAAQYLIASMFETGLGVAPDLRQAMTWYTAAARQGEPGADIKARAIAEQLARTSQ